MSTISPPSVQLGAQHPRFLTRPPSVSSAGAEAVELAALAGLHLDPWQQLALEVALAERPDGRWSAFEVALIVPRQNGKGGFLEALQLAALVLLGEKLILHSAHEFKTAQQSFDRVLALIEGFDELDRRVLKVSRSHGSEGIKFRDGQELRFVARSKGSGRGFSADRVILDEAYNLSSAGMSALLPTMSARPNPQIVYTSSAPLTDVESDVLRALCKRGRRNEPGALAYMEWCADEGAHPSDPEAIAAANPALGYRISLDFTANEQAAMSVDDFARERLGLWVDLEVTGAGVIPLELWDRCFVASSQPTSTAFAFDVAEDRSWSSIGVSDGRHVEVIEHLPNTDWLPARLAGIVARHGGTVTCDGTGPAASLIPVLRGLDVTVDAISAQHVQRASAGFYDLVVGGTARHIGQAELRTALTGAAKRSSGDAWSWSRRSSAVDISPVVAVSLAAYAASTTAPTEPFFVMS